MGSQWHCFFLLMQWYRDIKSTNQVQLFYLVNSQEPYRRKSRSRPGDREPKGKISKACNQRQEKESHSHSVPCGKKMAAPTYNFVEGECSHNHLVISTLSFFFLSQILKVDCYVLCRNPAGQITTESMGRDVRVQPVGKQVRGTLVLLFDAG